VALEFEVAQLRLELAQAQARIAELSTPDSAGQGRM
jgi:hypothetical protein